MSRFDRFKPRSIHEEIREERETCQRCEGEGEVDVLEIGIHEYWHHKASCPTCNGTGRVELPERDYDE